jgi:hypothetical protein
MICRIVGGRCGVGVEGAQKPSFVERPLAITRTTCQSRQVHAVPAQRKYISLFMGLYDAHEGGAEFSTLRRRTDGRTSRRDTA